MARTKVDFASREDADEKDHGRESKPDKKVGRKKTKRASWRKK